MYLENMLIYVQIGASKGEIWKLERKKLKTYDVVKVDTEEVAVQWCLAGVAVVVDKEEMKVKVVVLFVVAAPVIAIVTVAVA